ncbi:hypothetical protein D3C84_1077740 [compost metagenome]
MNVVAALQLNAFEWRNQFAGRFVVKAVPDELALQLIDAVRQLDQADHPEPLKVTGHGFDGTEVDFFELAKEAGAVEVNVGVGNAVSAEAGHYCAPRLTR